MDMQTLISKALEDAGITPAQISRELGISAQAVNGWLTTGTIGKANLTRLAERTNKPIEYFLKAGYAAKMPKGNYTVGVPVVGYVQGGSEDGYFTDMGYEAGDGDGIIALPGISPTAYAKRVRGDSMTPKMPNGSFVVADKGPDAMAGDDVLVHTHAGKSMVKQLLFERNGDVVLGSVNNLHGQFTLAKTDIAEMHLVLAYLPRGTKLYREKN